MYQINHESGVSNRANAKTLIGAKRKASKEMTYGSESVEVVDIVTGGVWQCRIWKNGHKFNWDRWAKVR
jgi:hypothetical protein